MDCLPSELLCLVIDDSSRSDLKALRLVNKRLASLVSPFLFKDITLARSSVAPARSAYHERLSEILAEIIPIAPYVVTQSSRLYTIVKVFAT
ncbi:hypothetical protein BX600DRAFT_111428 [Xylariales sp. PMI_506]|nr:hypothetical protein BX600DRAFT_111428 [Xylariales sp. PMI_506]